ncbi:lytic transglycosylase [Streptomyces catenulae]|uniref:Lytic transglycosylase n=1 Tax=Streptomyces catenulae TaxID=66875 RepID=A0ABV2Z3H6_9ACTN|nr:lytic transglycosylase [Streptomyces catenulae]
MAATFGRRLRRGAGSAAVAALVVAALTASQAPGAVDRAQAAPHRAPQPPADSTVDGDSPYYTDLPPLNSPVPPAGSRKKPGAPVAVGPAEAGIPATVLAAYRKAEASVAADDPGCRLPWQLLAAIGKVESGQARGGAVDAEGTTLRPILGPQLNGKGFALITDTDQGRYDGDRTHDRAVGPMQFIPSTWSRGGPDGTGWGADGNGDGKKDPHNIFDAALAAGHYLCGADRDLSLARDLDRAVLSYNHSEDYLRTVLSWYAFYRKGTHEVPDGTGVLPVQRRGGTSGGTVTRGGSAPAKPGRTPDDAAKDGAKSPGKNTGKEHEETRPGGGADTGGSSSGGTAGGTGGSGSTGGTGGTGGTGSTGGTGGKGDTGTGGGGTPPPTDPTEPTEPTTPAPLTALERTGDKDLTATTGTTFTTPPQVRAKDGAGKPVAGAPVRFAITGTTDTRFPDDATTVTVTTDKNGLATAPALRAGKTTGTFTVRATAVGRTVPPVDLTTTVQAPPAPKADTLTRTSDEELTVTAGDSYAADRIEIKAGFRGKAAAGVPVTATMVTDDADHPVPNTVGPSFTDPRATGAATDTPERTLTDLTTDADGLLKLPEIFTDADHPGTYRLRLTTADGAALTLELKVTAPAA